MSDYWSQILKSRETSYLGLIYRVPPRLWRDIKKAQEELRKTDPRQLYTSTGILHVPIKGLGFASEKMELGRYESLLSKVKNIVEKFKPFEVTFKGMGVFPSSIYVGVEDLDQNFKKINTKIGEELGGEIDHSRYDAEAFVPHVSIANFNTKDVSNLLAKVESMKKTSFGSSSVFELEVVEENLYLALGPEDTQDSAFGYLRSFHLSVK